ncbi:glycosyltransferase [Pseudoalteromonas sp. NEC-BIFX-2020_015]|uniref:glycosyltransferase n=1 Tax=Pseudoalteromonas sp. NEC-BIFX-2020_015 TaxID=2729544 RepID=UPI0014614365|nr:glycosyltransferase [Pseudoalteromonas sp. NEC-BIFX-2020_015]NMR23955.1 glycosyltransferase [Pseudoalteromonas sp. NEC-BIFX-2020_015]
MTALIPAIIIPAYNERNVIGRTLNPLYDGVINGEYTITIAVNGTSDDSVDFIRREFPQVTCLDIQIGSKTNALNEAEKQAGLGYPRIYMDADVVISYEGILSLIKTLSNSTMSLLASPKAVMNFAHSSVFVKAFYNAWFKTKFYNQQGFGSGVYGLNKAARQCFDVFPNVIADDGFIREVVPQSQQVVDKQCISTVNAPVTLSDLIKIKTRSKLGNLELKRKNLVVNQELMGKRFSIKPSLFEFLVYGMVNFIAAKSAEIKAKDIHSYKWQKDESSRNVV